MNDPLISETLPLPLRIYQRLSTAVVPLAPALIRRRLKQGKEDPARVGERRGLSQDVRPAGPLVWVHGASVGEVLAAASLVERLRGLGLSILLTSGTVTSAAMVARRFPDDVIHQYIPYDMPCYVSRFLDHWRPSLGLFIESDLWPNLIMTAAAQMPIVLINGRMSPRSFPRWRRAQATISALLSRFDCCLAQSAADAERFAALGSRNVVTTGNLKFDVPAPPADEARLALMTARTADRPIIVAASTHPGEEEMLIAAHRDLTASFPALLTVIVPRHPSRGAAVAALVSAAGLKPGLRSQGELPDGTTDIYVADTMGELGLFYRLTPIVFMGGSLIRHGGQNPIEAAKLGASIVHGPHVFNFVDVYAALDQGGGACVSASPETLVRDLGQLLSDPAVRETMQRAGHGVVARLSGALVRTLASLDPYVAKMRMETGVGNA